LPEQVVWVGAQTPLQTPLRHVWFVHATAGLQFPVASQVCTPLLELEHCTEPGMHTPLHVPMPGLLMHAWLVHATGVPHIPPVLHDCTLLPEHWEVPGMHTPVHTPFMHTEFVQFTVAPHVPLAVQVWTPAVPEHCFWVGAHTPVQTPETHVWFTHADGAPHVPDGLQVWTLLFEHCVVPG
jgi:hypothetical protein